MRHRLAAGVGLVLAALVSVSVGAQTPAPPADCNGLFRQGQELSPESPRSLEARVAASPEDIEDRCRLLGFYFLKSFESTKFREARERHVLWMIANRPAEAIATFAGLDPVLDGDAYAEGKRLWLRQAAAHGSDPAVLRNAASFFMVSSPDDAEAILKKGAEIEPMNPYWPEQLGNLHSLQAHSEIGAERTSHLDKSLQSYRESLSRASDETTRFYELADAARAALEADQDEEAAGYARELLAAAPKHPKDWNYGNAVHHGNLILGRVALRGGNAAGAKKCLIAAGQTPGSPQLDSFGPNMELARELLARGEREVVLRYFDLCAKFWKSGADQLASWGAAVKSGRVPDFGANLDD